MSMDRFTTIGGQRCPEYFIILEAIYNAIVNARRRDNFKHSQEDFNLFIKRETYHTLLDGAHHLYGGRTPTIEELKDEATSPGTVYGLAIHICNDLPSDFVVALPFPPAG